MNRRRFLQLAAAAMATPSLLPAYAKSPPVSTNRLFDKYFHDIFEGFKRNALATGPDYVVCDFPDGTKLKSCCTPSGRTYVSVARMLPAMTEWLATRGSFTTDSQADLREIVTWIFRKAFDPDHPDFWGYAPADKPTQRSVEAALVAISLVRAGNDLLAKLTPRERANINKWLASCTQVPERKNNHAWFTACNQAARLELSRTFPEFTGDEAWMLEDLKAMDALGESNSSDGWYTDSPDQPIYDLYNFYVFANFPLMWGQIIGQRYPDWNEKLRSRIKLFLQKAPYFFAANGSHPLMGRSLCYRFAVLSPLVLALRENLWPHSPGLLRRIVRGQLEYHWSLGCFDEQRGKLRETFSADETPAAREPYIDNGHPYWSMLGFAFLGIPDRDPFWTDPEEKLPVEKGDFLLRFDGPKFLLQGIHRTGEVRWLQSQNSAKRDTYRDKYAKFIWSSHFAYCASSDKTNFPPDQALIFRDGATGVCATRAPNGVIEGKLLDDGVETSWFAEVGGWRIEVVSTILLRGESQIHTHSITAPDDAVGKVEILAGAFADPRAELQIVRGFDRIEERQLDDVHLIRRSIKLPVAIGTLTASQQTFATLHEPIE